MHRLPVPGRGIGHGGGVDVVHADPPAAGQEQLGGRPADAARRAGDEDAARSPRGSHARNSYRTGRAARRAQSISTPSVLVVVGLDARRASRGAARRPRRAPGRASARGRPRAACPQVRRDDRHRLVVLGGEPRRDLEGAAQQRRPPSTCSRRPACSGSGHRVREPPLLQRHRGQPQAVDAVAAHLGGAPAAERRAPRRRSRRSPRGRCGAAGRRPSGPAGPRQSASCGRSPKRGARVEAASARLVVTLPEVLGQPRLVVQVGQGDGGHRAHRREADDGHRELQRGDPAAHAEVGRVGQLHDPAGQGDVAGEDAAPAPWRWCRRRWRPRRSARRPAAAAAIVSMLARTCSMSNDRRRRAAGRCPVGAGG